jgi:hypothetical protein
MAQASQQLPSWLTLSSTVITAPDGSVFTAFTTLQLPLTYFGPSVSLISFAICKIRVGVREYSFSLWLLRLSQKCYAVSITYTCRVLYQLLN